MFLVHILSQFRLKIGEKMSRTIHRWANTIAILVAMYFLYQITDSSEVKSVKQCEYLLMEELKGE
jgi:hypothetical protein